MKKWLALLLAALMILPLAACGEAQPDAGSIQDLQNAFNSISGGQAQDAAPAPTENSGSSEGPAATESVPDVEMTNVNLSTLSLSYPTEDGWVYDAEEDVDDYESWSRIFLMIPDPDGEDEDDYITEVTVYAEYDSPYWFRNELLSYGFDHYEYEVNHAYPLVNVGGIDCVESKTDYWGEERLVYLGRDEGSQTTVRIIMYGDCSSEQVQRFLEGITFITNDTGEQDGPWYWEGAPITGTAHTASIGSFNLQSQWVQVDPWILSWETFENDVAVIGNKVYLLADTILNEYDFDGTKLTFVREISLDDGDYEYLDADTNGILHVSGFLEDYLGLQNGSPVFAYDGPDYVAVHPSGTWGISWFSGPECEKLEFSGDNLVATDVTFSEVKYISRVLIDQTHVFVCASAADDSGTKIFIYDQNLNLQMTLEGGGSYGLGSVTYVAATSNGFIALDGNMREIDLWDTSGNFIGSCEDDDLFDTTYPWFCAADQMDDGSFLVIMTEERADQSCDELIVYRVSGF